MNNTLEKWLNFIDESYKRKSVRSDLKLYVTKIIENNSPVIFEFNHLSLLLGIEKEFLSKILNKPEYFYHEFSIAKRNGGMRLISSPNTALLYIQRWIYVNIIKSINLHSCCTGFREDYDIKTNASKHINQKIILKMDLKDFFQSISKRRVISVFRNIGYSTNLSYILASLCCNNNCLPQGAPTSPYLSNIIAKRLDRRLNALCEKFSISYTRYADDLTFSGHLISKKFHEYIIDIIEDEGFDINPNKTKFLYSNNQRIITGISVSGKRLTIPREKKRKIKQVIYFIKKFGIEEHLRFSNITDSIYLERTLGYLYFWQFVESNNSSISNYIQIIKMEIKKLQKKTHNFKDKNLVFVG